MGGTVQARLDAASEAALKRLLGRLGWSPSRVIREGVKLLDACYGRPAARRIAGVGRFESGIPDLGSNRRHLEGFGK